MIVSIGRLKQLLAQIRHFLLLSKDPFQLSSLPLHGVLTRFP